MAHSGRPAAVLFDLDGTLLDTAPDMAAALNTLRCAEGLRPLPFDGIRPHVSHGAARLIEIGFGCATGVRFEELRNRFLTLYSADIAAHTRPFDGLTPLLDRLEGVNIPWGIVTNKPGWLTVPLLAAVGLDARAGCIVSGDTLAVRKPHALPLLHAAKLLGCEPQQCVYIGDAERDVLAGRAAGMRTVVAAFGYLGKDEDPVSWGPDAVVYRPQHLAACLGLTEEA